MRRVSLFTAAVTLLLAAGGGALPALGQDTAYHDTVLVASSSDYHPTVMVDPGMIDAWGIAIRPPGAGGHFWINSALGGTSTEFIGDVNGVPLHQDGLTSVTLDQPAFADRGVAQATGIVYNAASDVTGQPVEFAVSGPAVDYNTSPPTPLGNTDGSAKFVFVTKDGVINAWRTNTASGMTSAVIIKDYSKESTTPLQGVAAVPAYTGVGMTTQAAAPAGAGGVLVADNHLFAADFENGRIQVFDNKWNDVTAGFGGFQAPASVAGLHPYNVQVIGARIYVTYAQLNPQGENPGEEFTDRGLGHVVAYDLSGHMVLDFAGSDELAAPWGMALAPETFGQYGGDLLVSNFGDGEIVAFDPVTGQLVGVLKDARGNVISIDGVWGLTFGNGVSLGDANSLYYTAGPNSEFDGEFGKLTLDAVPEPSAWAALALGGMVLGATCRYRRTTRA